MHERKHKRYLKDSENQPCEKNIDAWEQECKQLREEVAQLNAEKRDLAGRLNAISRASRDLMLLAEEINDTSKSVKWVYAESDE